MKFDIEKGESCNIPRNCLGANIQFFKSGYSLNGLLRMLDGKWTNYFSHILCKLVILMETEKWDWNLNIQVRQMSMVTKLDDFSLSASNDFYNRIMFCLRVYLLGFSKKQNVISWQASSMINNKLMFINNLLGLSSYNKHFCALNVYIGI